MKCSGRGIKFLMLENFRNYAFCSVLHFIVSKLSNFSTNKLDSSLPHLQKLSRMRTAVLSLAA